MSYYFNFVLPDDTITIEEDGYTAASLVEEVSVIGDTIPINTLSISVVCDNELYDELITAETVETYIDGVTPQLLGVFYIEKTTLPDGGTAKFELVDVIGKLDTETFPGGFYENTSYSTFLTALLGAGNYVIESGVSGTVSGALAACTRREALQQFAIATGAIVDPTRSGVIYVRSKPLIPTSAITASTKIVGQKLTQNDTAGATVTVTGHTWAASTTEDVVGSGAIAASSTGTIYFDTPCVLTKVNGYDATDTSASGYWRQMGITVVEQTAASITLTVPPGLIHASDPWEFSFAGYPYEDTPEDFTVGTGGNVKELKTAALVTRSGATTVANNIRSYYNHEYTAEGKLLPGSEKVGHRVTMTSEVGTLTGYIERMTTDLFGGGIRTVKLRGTLHPTKAPGSLSISPTSIAFNLATSTAAITVTRAGDGVISAVSSNTSVATVSVSGNTVTVTGTGTAGSATVIVSVAEGTYYLAPADATCAVTASYLSDTFADNSWETIIEACQSGTVPSTWIVGNHKDMTIGGTSYRIDIIGKNHDTYTAGGTAPLTFQLHDCYGTAYDMSVTSGNVKWTNTKMMNTYLPAILAQMPAAVQAAVKSVKKAYQNGSSIVSNTENTLFLLSTKEITGAVTPSLGTQYAYYTAGNDKKKKRSGSYVAWATRSMDYTSGQTSSTAKYYHISTSGGTGTATPSTASGVAFGFCF